MLSCASIQTHQLQRELACMLKQWIKIIAIWKQEILMINNESNNRHLAVVSNTETGLLHGAVYTNHPTPSGSDRWLLSKTTQAGFATERSAALAINSQFPNLEPIDVSALPEGTDDEFDRIIALLPKYALITHLTPSRQSDVMEKDLPDVEVSAFNSTKAPMLDIKIPGRWIKTMVARKIIEFESTSGNDSELSWRYDHYVVL